MAKKKKKLDACAKKVKARYKVWPSAYASGAVAKCRKVGAANWGNSTKKAAMGGLMTAVDNPKRKAVQRYAPGGMVASGCGMVEENRRKRTRSF
jgi:hypothetical protein|tara:strand:- start:574 stop:855 length:282 start_codon:yes stop_codon:yes gene_type:complete